ncbi:MAG TPA: FtsX-like permease family protein, partial [Acidobacteriaceae bacterium]|nr:FtsX-like permease family protein [Acidobacteriaceae bacterium]
RSRTAPARDRHRLWLRALMGLEVALALILVIGSGLLATSLVRLYRTGLGFDPNGLVNLQLSMDKQPLQGEALIHWYQQFGQALSHQPGVRDVSFESHIPLGGGGMGMMFRSPLNKGKNVLPVNTVAPNYFATMRIPLLAGREFRWTDKPAGQRVVILNQAAAKVMFAGKNSIGQQLTDGVHTYQVVGLAEDTKYGSLEEPAQPEAYLPITQSTADRPSVDKPSYTAVVRIDGPAAPLATEARSLLAKLAPDVPAPVMTTMSSELNESISSQRMMAMLASFFAVIALLVTAIGLYGVLAYSTARRTNEIGVRMALGARRPQVVTLVFRENLWSVLAGCAFGLAAALLAAHTLTSFLYGISPRDPWVLSASLVLLCLVAAVASLIPALRAASIDPMEALRCE